MTMFLLLHSTLVAPPGVAIDLPTGPELPGSTNRPVMIAADRGGRLWIHDQLVEEAGLREQLAELRSEPVSVVLLADKNLPSEKVMRLLTLVREAGITDIRWAVHSSAQPAAPPRRP